jgi:phosphoribosylformylglycinamidine synthase
VRIDVYAPGTPLEGDVVVLPDSLAAGPTPDVLRGFVAEGGRLLALGDGAGWLCAAGLLPGEIRAEPAATVPGHVRVEGRATPFTWAIPAGRILRLEPASGARYVAPDAEILRLGSRGQIVLRYCDAAGGVDRDLALAATVAGLSDESGRVLGLFAPATPSLGDDLGRQLTACLRRLPERSKGSPKSSSSEATLVGASRTSAS